MRDKYKTLTAPGVTAPIPLDTRIKPFNVSLFLILTGTTTASVEYTGDDVQAAGYVAASGNWFTHADLSAKTASAVGTLISPVTAVRLNVASTNGSATLQIIQAGNNV